MDKWTAVDYTWVGSRTQLPAPANEVPQMHVMGNLDNQQPGYSSYGDLPSSTSIVTSRSKVAFTRRNPRLISLLHLPRVEPGYYSSPTLAVFFATLRVRTAI